MRRALLALLWLGAALAWAAPPYDVTATFDPPPDGGTPAGYRFYEGCVDDANRGTLVGEVSSGQTFAGLLPGNGTYTFCVSAYNATGEGSISDVVQIAVVVEPVPGRPVNLQITVTCDASCTVDITILQ